jgi:oligoendopeptidase F
LFYDSLFFVHNIWLNRKKNTMTQIVLSRSEVAEQYMFDVSNIFPSLEAWKNAISGVSEQLPELARFEGHLGDSPAILADWFAASESVLSSANKIYIYAQLLHDVDTADQTATAMLDQASGLTSRVGAAVAFAEPELLAIDAATLDRWVQEDPRLAPYAHYFDRLQKKKEHVRSAEVEELLSQVEAPFASARRIHGTLTDADMRFEPARGSDGSTVEIAQGNIGALLTDADRELRRTAWENYADAHLAVQHTLANCLATGVRHDVFRMRARRYDSSLEASLGANNIPVEVFHNLIDTYKRNLPVWHRYWRMRRRALGYDALHVYDIKAPMTTSTIAVPFEQSVEWISQGMLPLGEEYVAAMRDGLLEQRWVDVYPNKGKRAGAYSSGTQGTNPFILMSYNDDIFSMSTLAHELGHSLHSYFTWRAQPQPYARYSLFVAEVASNFNQALVRSHLLNSNDDPQFQIAVLEEAMSNFHRYFFIMPTLARFELEIHERVERGEALTADSLNSLLTDLFRDGYGDEVVIDAERVGITWAQFPIHMYYNFYVYQYATGIAAAHALADQVLTGGDAARERYLAFLRAGGSVYPLDALKAAGVDMTTPAPVEQTFRVLESYVERLEQLTA